MAQTRTTTAILVVTFFHALSFFAAAFYLPVYFQVMGASATRAGVEYVVHAVDTTMLIKMSTLATGCYHYLLERQPCLLFLALQSPRPVYIDP